MTTRPLHRASRRAAPLVLPANLPLTGTDEDFAVAVDWYKRAYRRPWPCLSEILEIVKLLGWRKQESTDARS